MPYLHMFAPIDCNFGSNDIGKNQPKYIEIAIRYSKWKPKKNMATTHLPKVASFKNPREKLQLKVASDL